MPGISIDGLSKKHSMYHQFLLIKAVNDQKKRRIVFDSLNSIVYRMIATASSLIKPFDIGLKEGFSYR
jgi:hypothetical protein